VNVLQQPIIEIEPGEWYRNLPHFFKPFLDRQINPLHTQSSSPENIFIRRNKSCNAAIF